MRGLFAFFFERNCMPKGQWTPPEAGDAPQEVKDILKKAYAAYRDKHPGENPATKTRGAKIAWTAVHNAGWSKNKDGKWTKSKEMATMKAKDFVIFRTGTWNGQEYTEKDLDEMVARFNPDEPPHILVGHSSDYKGETMIPSFGRILGGLKRVGGELIAVGAEFAEELVEWIKKGLYPGRSIELTKDNQIVAVGLLGVKPPAVQGLPTNDKFLEGMVLAYAKAGEMRTIEFADPAGAAPAIDFEAIEDSAIENTVQNIEQAFATCLADIENHLESEDEGDEVKQDCMTAMMECYQDVSEEIMEHFTFTTKLEELEPEEKNEMMDRIKQWLHIETKPRKESEVDKKKEQEYQTKIAELEAQNKEFADAKKASDDAKAAADADKVKAEADAADVKLRSDIKEFLDKNGKGLKVIDEMNVPELMFQLAKSSGVVEFKSGDQTVQKTLLAVFQDLLIKIPTVQLGEAKEFVNKETPADNRSQVVRDAEQYVKTHPKEFADLDAERAINRALYWHSVDKIKFESKQTI